MTSGQPLEAGRFAVKISKLQGAFMDVNYIQPRTLRSACKLILMAQQLKKLTLDTEPL